MPVTAKLSRDFYERFGEKIAEELVNWFNQVDATYRNELRELNELNFARFDAKLEQRTGQLEAKLEERLAQFEAKVEQRLAQFEAKVEQRFAQLEARLEQRIAELRAELDGKIAGLRAEFDIKIADLRVALERRLSAQTRWLFAAWAVVLGSVIGLYIRRP